MNYKKLDVAMLNSTIWLEDVSTRIVWLTLLLSMNQDYVAEFSSVRNLALRANVSEKEAKKAVSVLESPDPESHSKREEGRRIVRVDGGWFVVNGDLYQEWALIELAKKKTRERVQRHRENKTLQVTNSTDVTVTSVTGAVTHGTHKSEYESNSSYLTNKTFLRKETSLETERYMQRLRALGFRDSTAIDAEHAFAEVLQAEADAEEVVEACARIYVWTKQGKYARNLANVIRRWKEPQHLWEREEELTDGERAEKRFSQKFLKAES